MGRTADAAISGGAALLAVLVLIAGAGCLETRDVPAASPVATQSPAPVTPPYHRLPLYFFSLYGMQERAAPSVVFSLPTYLPEGFFFTTGTQVEASGNEPADAGYYSFAYQRGQEESIFLTEQPGNSSACPEEPVYQIAGTGTTHTQKQGAGELTWGRDGWCFILSGLLPRSELERIALSVTPVPYREGIMPPFEYQPPEHPLVRSFSVNRSATAEGLKITVVSLDCTPDACTAAIRLDPAPQPPASLPNPAPTTMPPIGSGPRAEWRVDGGRPLLTMPGGGMTYNETAVFWKIEPLPEDSGELVVNFSRARGIAGAWQITIPLRENSGSGQPSAPGNGVSP